MSTYKIKMEDKAALLNRLEKAEVNTDSYNIIDNKMKGYFEIIFTPLFSVLSLNERILIIRLHELFFIRLQKKKVNEMI
jgi:hypothetical protein